MPIVRIVVDGDDANVFSPFAAKDLIKSMPDRTWNASAKCWTIPAYDVDDLTAVLEAEGYKIVVTHKTERREQRRESPRGGRTAGGTWADLMFMALSPELGAKAYRALSRALHPDVGGSTEQMQILNSARDRFGNRS